MSASLLSGAVLTCSSLSTRNLSLRANCLTSRTCSHPPARQDGLSRAARSTTRCEAGNGQQPDDAAPNHAKHSNGRRHDRHDSLPLSLYNPYTSLPCDGRTQTEADEACDPYTRNCQTTMHVWETNCKKCHGTGTVTSYSGRGGRGRGARRASYTCPTCHGLGCVRHTSTRIMPDVAGGNGQYTAGRPPCKITWKDDGKQKTLFDRFKEKLGG